MLIQWFQQEKYDFNIVGEYNDETEQASLILADGAQTVIIKTKNVSSDMDSVICEDLRRSFNNILQKTLSKSEEQLRLLFDKLQ